MDPISERLAKLSPEKLALLMERLREKESGRPPASAIPRRSGSGPCPPSFAQQRLWFIDQLEAGTWAYNVLSVTRFEGELDVRAMQRALDAVVERHEALRTVFAVQDGAPVQVVLPELRVPLETESLEHLSDAGRDAELKRRVNLEPRRPLDLAAGPLLRASLLRLAPESHVLLLTLHHIISDGWSRGVMVREISALYTAFVKGEEPRLPELPIQYPDYTVWQREWLQGENLHRQLDYWTGKLRGAAPALELPTDRPRPPLQAFEGALHRFRIPGPLADALRGLARREEATLFMVLLAAFKVLLRRYSGQTDVVVGSPVANRGRVETEGLVGFFANTLALRTDLSGDPTFREVVRRVRETALGAYAHEELPFERLVEALQPARDLSRSPVFQVMFLLDNTPVKKLRLPELSLEPVEVDTGISSFDLTLMMEEKADGLAGGLEYATALFDEDTVARMARGYLSLLEGAAADPDLPVGRLPLLPPEERLRVTVEFNRTDAAFPEPSPVYRRFEARARSTPDAPAVVWEGGEITYGELDARAGRLASRLRARGVGPETRVGVLAERSPEMVVAVLAVLKAGGAYVPLDPEYPAERLRLMAGDAGLHLVLAQRGAADRPGGEPGAPVVVLEEALAGAPSGAEAAPVPEVGPGSAAYVIYTSGSTGTPKGVVVEHRSLANYVEAATRAYGITAGDRVLQFASLSFDISVEEIFPTLCAGAALVLRAPGGVGSVDAFLEEVGGRGVTVMSLPTAFWHEVTLRLESGEVAVPPRLRLVILGGERAQADRLAAWRSRVPATVRLVNTYGPTETTVIATLHDLTPPGDDRVPIGAPVANLRAYVLDGAMEPLPVGVPGELYVGGEGVARGYLGRPGPTAERFVPDPFGDRAGGRLYRTGDRVRWHLDGTLDFLGRVDAQVKIRGYRVEPGEVEAVLRTHPRVEQAAVVACETAGAPARLLGYFTRRPGAEPEEEGPAAVEELRGFLAARLPAYLVPAAFVELEEWPLTPGGKVDLRALPAPEEEAQAPEEREPTPLERVLARIWAEALRTERVGIDRNLFDLGAHSLLVTRVLSQVKSLCGVEVPVRAFFLRPTVAGMAAELLRAAPRPAQVERIAELTLHVAELSDAQVRSMAESHESPARQGSAAAEPPEPQPSPDAPTVR
ncbi:MAG TPA: amino acid adenylation domain-containing protein [Longimicrobiaceae bacterium]|nr:amino acid adenylation domain-containing protein [Longimicrobiaceae bacterium]